MKRITLVAAISGMCLLAQPIAAANLVSGTVFVDGADRVSCGVVYKGDVPIKVVFEIFNFANQLLDTNEADQIDPEPGITSEMSPDTPATAWRTTGCPDGGCQVPWCKVTVPTKHKKKIRATMCLDSASQEGEETVFTTITCIPLQ